MSNYAVKMLKKPDVTDLAGEKVMIDFESGKYFMLTGSANDIWDIMETKTVSDEIISELLDIYEVEPDVCKDGVMGFLRELESIGFISLEELV